VKAPLKTGFAGAGDIFAAEVRLFGAKRLELLHEVVPTATAVAVLVNPSTLTAVTLTRDLQAAAHTLGLQLHVLHASTERDVFCVSAGTEPGGQAVQFFGRSRDGHDAPHSFRVMASPGPSCRRRRVGALRMRLGIR
jgi:hypothetical protein